MFSNVVPSARNKVCTSMRNSDYPPCNVEMKTTTSLSSNVVSSWPLNSQSQSFTKTRTPGRLHVRSLSIHDKSRSYIVMNIRAKTCNNTTYIIVFKYTSIYWQETEFGQKVFQAKPKPSHAKKAKITHCNTLTLNHPNPHPNLPT